MSRSSGLVHLLLVLLLWGPSSTRAWPVLLDYFVGTTTDETPSNETCNRECCVELEQSNDTTEGIESMPFGALPSDWTRLMLLQESQPEGSTLREHLVQLSKVVLAAYFAREDKTWLLDSTTNDYGLDSSTDSFTGETTLPEETTEVPEEVSSRITIDNGSTESLAGNETKTYYDRTSGVGSPDETTGSFLADVDGTTIDSLLVQGETTIVSGNNFEESSENSRSNEAVHEKSKEDFAAEKHRDEIVARFVDSRENDEGQAKDARTDDDSVKPSGNNGASSEVDDANSTRTAGPEETTLSIKDVDDFFARESNESTKNSSEEFAGLLTKSVEELFEQASNETLKNSTSLEVDPVIDKIVEDFFASNESMKNSVQVQDPVAKSIENFFEQSSNEKNSTELHLKSVEDFFDKEGNETEKVNLESSEEVRLTKSEEDFFTQSSNETTDDDSPTTLLPDEASPIVLTNSAETYFKNKEDEAVQKVHQVRSLEEARVEVADESGDQPGSTTTLPSFTATEVLPTAMRGTDSTTTTNGTDSDTTESGDTTRLQETTTEREINGTTDASWEGATTERHLMVPLDEKLPTPLPHLMPMRKVLMTWTRHPDDDDDDVGPNELMSSHNDYDIKEEALDTFLEFQENLGQQPRVEYERVIGTLANERKTRKRPGVQEVQYQTLSKTEQTTPAEKRSDEGFKSRREVIF